MSLTSREIHLAEIPEGLPAVEHFTTAERVIEAPLDGQVLVRNLYMSVDPAIRPRLSNGVVKIGEPMAAATLGEIVESAHPDYSAGDIVRHDRGFREYALCNACELTRIEVDRESLTTHLGVLGVNGLTAYAGLFDVGNIRPGETVFVSAAAGGVGSVAAQIARLTGCRVIGSAGSDKKCAWLREVAGIDAVINYKEGSLRKNLKAVASEGIDVYFDNVGGEHLNAALPRMNKWGRVAVCGMISSYNNIGSLSDGVTTLANMMYNRITMRGFIVWDYEHLWPKFTCSMRAWLADGAIKYEETIYDGLEDAPRALISLFAGENLGKTLVRIAEETD